MPQFDPAVAFPQIVWLIAVFAILYIIVQASLPKVERVVGSRAGVIGADLNEAEAAKAAAARAMAEYEASLAAARASAAQLTEQAKARAAADAAARMKTVEDDLARHTAAAMAKVEKARGEALASLRSVAEEATAEIVERLTGRRPTRGEVAAAVAA